jgi:2-methylcitrate dehydratase PrpD
MSRRGLLQAGTALAASTALPRSTFAAEAAVSPLMTKLSAYMADAANKKLPDAVMERTKQAILDTFGAMISGAELPPGKFALNFAKLNPGERSSTIAASNLLCGPIEAALINGLLAHSDETDDTHPGSLSHPGAAVLPSALAASISYARLRSAMTSGRASPQCWASRNIWR